VLQVARARVARARQEEYLALIGELAAAARAAGAHLWVFRHRHDPELFIEFREGAGEPPRDPAPAASRLAGLASYEAGGADVWEELPTHA
jgi:hypothetical protein